MKQIFAVIAVLGILAPPARGELIAFDFDAGTPPSYPGKSTAFAQTLGGVTAQFSSPTEWPGGPAFALQHTSNPIYQLSQFSGYYLYDVRSERDRLQIRFSAPLDSITLDFATAETPHGIDEPSEVQLTAYLDSTGTLPVGTAIARGTFSPAETFPQGTLNFDSGGVPFNLVELMVASLPPRTGDFFVDDIVVNVIPEPASVVLLGIGLVWLVPLFRRRRRAT